MYEQLEPLLSRLAAFPSGSWPTSPAFWISELIKLFILHATIYASAQLVIHRGVKVNYTRKINHFALFFVPILLWLVFEYERTEATMVISSIIVLLAVFPFFEPIRRRIQFFDTAFRSLDRPEDRPNTMVWLVTQIVAGYLVVVPIIVVLEVLGHPDLIMIPVLVNAIGDGLAEPVGVRFGRHAFSVRAIFTDRRYTRTLEGSACVFISAVAVVLFFAGAFSPPQLAGALLGIPVVMTLAEAWSPHTWDTPFLFFAGGAAVIAVLVLL